MTMPLYKPGKISQKRGEGNRSGGFSAVPRGRHYQLDFHHGKIVVDKSKDIGRSDFEEEVTSARNDSSIPEDEVALIEEFGNLESGVAVWFGWQVPSGGGIRVNLTRLTEEELDALRESILCAVEVARPEVQRRDEEARRAEQEGFYGLHRVTRTSPTILDFRGKIGQHGARVSVGRKGSNPVGATEGDTGSKSDTQAD